MRYLALDPGSQKVGIAVAEVKSGGLQVLYRQVVPISDLQGVLQRLIVELPPDRCLIGGGTGCKRLLPQLRAWFPALHWERVDERETTLRARKRYFDENPPRGWRRLIPRGLLTPPEPYDDYVAVLLIERAAAE